MKAEQKTLYACRLIEVAKKYDQINGNIQLQANSLCSLIEQGAVLPEESRFGPRSYVIPDQQVKEAILKSLRDLVNAMNEIQNIVFSKNDVMSIEDADKYLQKKEEGMKNLADFLNSLDSLTPKNK